MGKIKEGSPAVKGAKASSGSTIREGKRAASFFSNFLQVAPYKPLQGRRARWMTAAGLGATLLLGLRLLALRLDNYGLAVMYGVPTLLAVGIGWLIYRLIQYPPFAEFLIATEAEMNKVSWTSKEDLKRATGVVLMTVVLMSVFLFGVDWLWSTLLQLIGVLHFTGGGGFGSTG